MDKHNNSNKKIEEILASADGIKRASPKPFLYTRLLARMEQPKETVWETAGRIMARPVVAFAGLSLLLLLNTFLIAFNDDNNSAPPATEQVVINEELPAGFATLYDLENP